jgi:hypothetical protein
MCLGITAACDPSGSALWVENQWDRAVMVRAVAQAIPNAVEYATLADGTC